MKEKFTPKYPHSVQLFKLCYKILQQQREGNVKDSEVGDILGFNSSDCSHWKRGVKNVRSVFALNKLSETLGINSSLLHEVVFGNLDAEQAFFEYQESKRINDMLANIYGYDNRVVQDIVRRVSQFVESLHERAGFSTPPLYIPEILRLFDFISTQSVEISTKLSRILKIRPGVYAIQYKRGDLTSHVRYSMLKDVAKIIFEVEKNRFEWLLGVQWDSKLLEYAQLLWVTGLLVPPKMLIAEMSHLDVKRNMLNELATIFWIPKFIVNFQISNIINYHIDTIKVMFTDSELSSNIVSTTQSVQSINQNVII